MKKYLIWIFVLIKLTEAKINEEMEESLYTINNSNNDESRQIENILKISNNSTTFDYQLSNLNDLNFLNTMNAILPQYNNLKPEAFDDQASSSSATNSRSVSCYWVNTTTFEVWDLSGLSRKTNKEELTLESRGKKIAYNFCGNTIVSCDSASQAVLLGNENNCFRRLAGNSKDFNLWKMRNDLNNSDGVIIYMNPGQSCDFAPSATYVVQWDLKCNMDVEFNIIDKDDIDFNTCILKIKGETKHACPISGSYIISKFVNDNKIWVGIIMLVFGLLLAFIGTKFFWITLIVLICSVIITVIFIVYFILQAIIDFQGSTIVIIILFVVGIFLGVSIGLCLKSMTTIFFIGIGGFMGYVLGMFLYNIFLNKIHSNPHIVYWVTIGVCILIGMIIGYKFLKLLFIFTTSFFGSYLTVRAISLWAGGFPAESLVTDLINRQEWDELGKILTGVVYAYLAGWLVLTIASLWYQLRVNKDLTDDHFRGRKKEDDDE